jgi:hypothetical protein
MMKIQNSWSDEEKAIRRRSAILLQLYLESRLFLQNNRSGNPENYKRNPKLLDLVERQAV